MEDKNSKKLKKQKTFFMDRFPYIIFILIIGISLIIFFVVKARLPLAVFTKKTVAVEAANTLDLYFASPTKNQTFELVSVNETVPVEIKGKNVENNENYNVNIFVNSELIKTLSSSPYSYNWSPSQTGAYDIYAEVTDKNNKVLYTSEKVSFSVNIKGGSTTDSSSPVNINIEEKKNKLLEKTSYRSQNAVPIFALKCYSPPVIDGSIDEWGIFDKFSSFTPTILKENYTNAKDVSGTFSSCWDKDNFYFFVKVIDDVYNQPYNTNQVNKGDNITFVLDAELEKDFNIPFLNSDDYQMEFSAGNNSSSGVESFVRWPSNTPLKGAVLAAKKGSGGYTIEGSIPWYSMPALTPADELVMGFTVSIFDTDNLESTELVVSSSKQFVLNDVSSLGTLILIDGGDPSLSIDNSSSTSTTKPQ